MDLDEMQAAIGLASSARNNNCQDCFWKRELRRVEQDHQRQKHTMELGIQERLTDMEIRFDQRCDEVAARAAEVGKESRSLKLTNRSLTQEKEALQEELEATRHRQHLDKESFQAEKSCLETKSASLEEEVRECNKNINGLKTELNYFHTACASFKDETDKLSNDFEVLLKEQDLTIQNCLTLRDKLLKKMQYVEEQCEKRIENMTTDSKQQEHEKDKKIKELSEHMENRELLISQLLETVESRDIEFEKTAAHIQKLVKGTLEEVLESMKKIDTERDNAIRFKRNVEEDLVQVAQVLNTLNDVILQQQKESDSLCKTALNELGPVEVTGEQFLNTDSRNDGEDAGNASWGHTIPLAEIASNTLERIKRGEDTLKSSFQAIRNYKRRNDEQVMQLTKRIEELAQLTSGAKLKHMREMDNLSQKVKAYKKVILSLRQKLSKEAVGSNPEAPGSRATPTTESVLRNPEDPLSPRYLELVTSLLQFNCKVDDAENLAKALN